MFSFFFFFFDNIFFSITIFLHSSVFLGSPSEPVYVPWLNKILGNATLQQYQDRFDPHIEQNLKENFAYSKWEYLPFQSATNAQKSRYICNET